MDEGLLKRSKAEMVHCREPLYLTGLAILFILILTGPMVLRVIVEALLLIELAVMDVVLLRAVTEVLAENTKSLGKYKIIVREMDGFRFIKDSY